MYIYIHTYIRIHIHRYIYIRIYTYGCVHTGIHIDLHSHSYTSELWSGKSTTGMVLTGAHRKTLVSLTGPHGFPGPPSCRRCSAGTARDSEPRLLALTGHLESPRPGADATSAAPHTCYTTIRPNGFCTQIMQNFFLLCMVLGTLKTFYNTLCRKSPYFGTAPIWENKRPTCFRRYAGLREACLLLGGGGAGGGGLPSYSR